MRVSEIEQLRPGDVVTFTEYELSSMTGRRHMRRRMENVMVAAVIRAGDTLPYDQMEEYFGDDITDQDRVRLAVSVATRIMVKDDDQNVYCLHMVDDFLRTGLQTLEIGQRAEPIMTEAPSYLQFLTSFGGTQ